MIPLKAFYRAIRSFRYPPDKEQTSVVEKNSSSGLLVVAGPGSGKTTSLTLRILKLVLVDGVPPKAILATTFTVKASQELRSRILGWGFRMIDFLLTDSSTSEKQHSFLKSIDINQIWTGTIDSLCEQLLRDFRAPGTQPPVLADEFVAKTLLLRDGLFHGRKDKDSNLDEWLLNLHSDSGNRYGFHIGTKVKLLQTVWDRRYQDQVDWKQFLKMGTKKEKAAKKVLGDLLIDYEQTLSDRGMVDFSLLENEVLLRLRAGQLDEFLEELQVVLVDEYQDSNLLQEQIYFELAMACNGALCVVGDDDQSLYRFRGATVDLFRDFESRYLARFGHPPEKEFLSTNYRSTKNIIEFVDQYANLDPDYQTVRIAGKPSLRHGPNAKMGALILGMFRDSIEELSLDLSKFLHNVFRGNGVKVQGFGKIKKDLHFGDVGDCALLCSSPSEYSSSGNPRLPYLMREECRSFQNPISVFNPRGQDFSRIELVEIFGGFLLECLDPGAAIQPNTSGISTDEITTFERWREKAIDFINNQNPPADLEDYAMGWVVRDPKRKDYEWPKSVSVIDLIYGLVHFFPELHDDPEGQVYLEVFTRQLGACEQVGKFKGRLVCDPLNQGLEEASVKELLRDFLTPIASGTISVDEDLIESFPRDRLSILSIHQSKGLEFPLTIVDVGSDFRTNHHSQRFKRHPQSAGTPQRLEDLMRQASPLGNSSRPQLDRAFDDLFRQFFVAFSRAQDVLLLVGVRPTFPGGVVANVATGWDRHERCHWTGNNLPFLEI